MTCLYKKTFSTGLVAFLLALSIPASAATFPVTSNADSGPGTLRAAIVLANGTAGIDDITFNLPGGSTTISLATGLPVIIEGVNINGYTQPLSASGPIASRTIVVEINGAGMPGGSPAIVIASSNVTISGLAIYSAPDYAVTISTNLSDIHIWGNYFGTNATGNTPGLGNGGGVNNNIGGPGFNTNIIVGTNGDGANDANEGNLFCSSVINSALTGWGIAFWQAESSTIAGNIVGLDKDGNVAGMGNAQDGILMTVQSTGNVIGTNSNGISDNLEGNIVSANGSFGILVAGASDFNIIAGNTFGLDAANNAAGNVRYGIGVLNSSGLRIGTNADGSSDNLEGNIVSANGQGGIGIVTYDFFTNASSDNNVVAGNIIGTDASLTLDLGNTGSGILLRAEFPGLNVSNNTIGSNGDGDFDAVEANVITNNDTGINIIPPVAGAASNGNKISRNRIFANSQMGIDLNGDGVTLNDDGDADAGANDLFNAPVLLTTQVSGGNLVLTGFTRPGSVVEFYVSDGGITPNPLPGGFTKSFGEGQTFLFRAQDDALLEGVNDDDLTTGTYDGVAEGTNAGGTRTENRFSFTVPIASLPVVVGSGTRITALAYENTAGPGSTSEFAGTISTSAMPVTLTSFRGRVDGDKAELTWTTAEEINNSHFEIERSANGQAYSKVGTVKGNGGSNNSYQFTDNGPLSAVNYYRLKQVDVDGRSTYARTLVLRKDLGEITAKAAPSPFTSYINLSYKLQKEENIRIRLIDQVGRIVKTYSTRGGVGVNTINLNGLDHLPKGNYTVELTGERVSFRQMVLKQ
jgi:hypothetical protein